MTERRSQDGAVGANPTPTSAVASRELAEQAKNAVKVHTGAVLADSGIDRCCETWDALAAAIDRLAALAAQPAAPVVPGEAVGWARLDKFGVLHTGSEGLDGAFPVFRHPAAPAVLAEPVAYLCGGSLFHSRAAIPSRLLPPVGIVVPLYTHPASQARSPLTDILPLIPKDESREAWSFSYPDGMTAQQAANELSDYAFLLEQVSKVYCHVTGGRLSKTNYHASAVIGVHDELRQEEIDEALEEERQSVLGDRDDGIGSGTTEAKSHE